MTQEDGRYKKRQPKMKAWARERERLRKENNGTLPENYQEVKGAE